ncbi:Pogo transposable element with ZNF domain [Frankliniella fusca]|uniref:Pogo transposable element with ZNF domain n=1 Tax=Frankliniella fusca TaxID=407009 RepID=A0AAE1LRM5_9NEOP|nr:Pogo transposable element with ZNF domain [Frankliniella fusca]
MPIEMGNKNNDSGADEHSECLTMDYWSEGLSDAQKTYYSKADREYNDIIAKLSEFISKENGAVIERGSDVVVLQGSTMNPSVSVLNNLGTPVSQPFSLPKGRVVTLQSQTPPPLQAVSSQQLVIQGGGVPSGGRVTARTGTPGTFQTPSPGTVHLVMDPRHGHTNMLIVQAQGNQLVQAPAPQSVQPSAPPSLPCIQSVQSVPPSTAAPDLGKSTTRTYQRNSAATTTMTTPSSQAKGLVSSASSASNISNSSTQKGPKPIKSKPPASTTTVSNIQSIPSNITKPTENNCIGGLAAGNPKRKSILEESKNSASGPDSKEVTFNKVSGKTFPSLVVLARPYLRVREMTQAKINQERGALDSKVKSVLMYGTSKFTEWLIQNGLVRGDQFCLVHRGTEGALKLKLGMYSEPTKFPFSGGYVWVSECCPQRFVSVFSGSIFEGAPHPPSVLLKLMYHWCCQTNVQNVIQWVKVDNFYVKNFFTHMRSICVAAVHENHETLGGPLKKVEVGVISLGTTSQDGNMRQVKVEVLGVMDTESKLIRLRAVEPFQDGERNFKRRFVKILEPLKHWVHPDSMILTDFTVDKGTLADMGFNNVHQSTIPDPPSPTNTMSNQNVMEYLRRIVPRMFQNTLSLLSRQIIQQFLDELVWRERWGHIPSLAFDTLVSHLAAQSKLDSGESLIVKLGKIAANPFRIWKYDHWKTDGVDSLPVETVPVLPSNTRSPKKPEEMIDDTSCPNIARAQKFVFTLDEDTEQRVKNALKLIDGSESIRKAIETYKVPRSVVLDRVKEILQPKQTEPGPGQPVFTDEEEEDIKDHLMTLYDWGYPFSRCDIRLVVKQYLDTCGRKELRFRDNCPPDMWIERFLSRHVIIRHRLCQNLPARTNPIDVSAIKQYVMNLSNVIQLVPPQNILNIMEIGLTGDPLKTMGVELRELRHPPGKRKVKSAASVMLACTAVGKVLPSYVVYEGKLGNTNEKVSGEFYTTKSGWFDEVAFGHWVESVLLPWAEGLEGKKVIIGDSLAQLFTLKSLALCMDKNISFVAMPCNVSGVLSPLDIVLCDKLRMQWRVQMRSWSTSHRDKYITIEDYPFQVEELLKSTVSPDTPQQLRKAFKVIGLYPFSSKNTMIALENGGVSLEPSKQKQNQSKKRKRIYIGTVENMGKCSVKRVEEKPVYKEVTTVDAKRPERDIDAASIIEAFRSSKDLIELDPYYYGTKPPSDELVKNEFKVADLTVKCPMCHHVVSDNLTLMKHIFGHTSIEEPTLEELSHVNLCRYCTRIHSSQEELENHVLKVHKNLSSQANVCLICAEEKADRENLIVHMHKTHDKMELPYICTMCHYRSSEQYKLVDHFYEVHAGGERVQCPFCLKCVAISNMGKKMAANTIFYMHHVKKHQAELTSRKCDKCALWFVHKGILKEHQANDHISCKDDKDIIPYQSSSGVCVMMPSPMSNDCLDVRASYDPEPQRDFYQSSIRGLITNLNGTLSRCVECGSSLDDHYLDSMLCSGCSFSTCCSVAMTKHRKVFHRADGANKIQVSIENLRNAMHCSCGFESRDGNILASHLAMCRFGNGVAYPPKPFSTELSIQKGPSSLLNSLGLMKNTPATESDNGHEYPRDRPLSRASNASSSSSYKRKRTAQDASFDSPQKDTSKVQNTEDDEFVRQQSNIDPTQISETDNTESNSQVSEAISSSEKLVHNNTNVSNGTEHM